MAQGLQGAGLRLLGRSGRRGRTGRGAHRRTEPLRQAGGDLGVPLRRHPRKGALRRRGTHRGVPRGSVCGLPLLRHRRCAHRFPLWLRPQLHQLCLQRPAGRRPGRDPYRHQHRQLCRCRGGAAVCGKTGCKNFPSRQGVKGLFQGAAGSRREQDRHHPAG